jgi:hypothetical protein
MDPFALARSAFDGAGGNEPQATPADSSDDLGAGTGAAATQGAASAGPDGTLDAQGAGAGDQQPPDELTRLRQENERLRAGQPEPAASPEVQRIRRYVGMDAIHEGGPSLSDLDRAIQSRDYNGLYSMRRPDGSQGYTLEEAIDLKGELEGRRAILDQATGLLHGAAWGAIGSAFDEIAPTVGLDPKQLATEAASAGNPLATTRVYLTRMLEAAAKTGKDAGVKEWKGKHDSLRAEFDAYKAERAGGAAQLESGGRGNSGKSAQQLLALSDEEFVERAIRGEFAGVDMRD